VHCGLDARLTEFIHQYLTVIEAGLLRSDAGNNPLQRREIPGDVIQAAINSGLRVAEIFANGAYLDIGTPEDLVRAVRNEAAQEI